MKRFYLIILLLGMSSMFAFSQRLEGGALAGLNASQVDGDTFSGYHKPGAVFGVYVQTNLSRYLYACMELKFAQKGSRNIDSLAIEGQIKYVMRLNYAELPVYLGIRTSEKTSVLFGLSPCYLISGKEFNDYGIFQTQDQHPFNAFDLEALLGFRFQITKRIYIDLRGAYSLLPIRNQPGTPVSYWKSNQFNNLLNTTLLYRLDF
jgi:hypothetical protein